MSKISPDSLSLPTDWIAEELGFNVISLRRPGSFAGFVTIDFTQRIFSGGCGQPHQLQAKNTQHYSGRGWQQAIVRDAVQWLDGVMQ